jgi:molybdopterin-binding protein
MDPVLVIKALSVSLGEFALRTISLEVGRGEYFIILGPTGAGKTILLETIAGIHRPDSGSIVLENREITTLTPRERRVGMVYQDYMLFPHLTAGQNIAFGLRQENVPKEEQQRAVREISSMLGIDHLLDRMPATLSGGEQQRTSLARALVLKPGVLLLDEPMNALDSRSRELLRSQLVAIQKHTGTTIVQITHHFEDVYLLADRVAIMRNGRIVQIGEPSEVFLHPADAFVADFLCIGNLIRGVSSPAGKLARITTNGQEFYAASEIAGKVVATLHPEDVILSREPFASSARNCLACSVREIIPVGSTVRIVLDAGFPLTALLTRESCRDLEIRPGTRVYATFKATAVHIIAAAD